MELDPEPFIIRVDEAEGMAAVAIHVGNALRNTSFREQNGYLVQRLRNLGPEVPLHCIILGVRLGIAFLCMDEIRKFDGIPDEKYRRVVPDKIPVAFLGVELQCKAPNVSYSVCGTFLTCDGRNRPKTSVFLPTSEKSLAFVYLVMS